MNQRLTIFIWIILFTSQLLVDCSAATRRYRLVWNDNPSTTMGFALDQYNNGSGSLTDPVIYYGTSPSNMTTILQNTRYESERGMDNYFFKATGLQAGTIYYFFVQDSQTTSQTFYFETAPDDPSQALSILAGGDSRAAFSGGDQDARQKANQLVAKLRPHCVLFGGDFTNLDTNGEWQNWMDDWQLTIASDGRMTPIIPARGNHELTDGSRVYDLFNTASGADTYYALTLGGDLLRIYTLNSMISVTGNQALWLENDLSTSCTNWKIAQYHYPIRPHNSEKDEQDDQRSAWCPAFENHGLQLAIESDSHLCKYTHPVKMSTAVGSSEGFIRDDQNGIVYIGEGGWGATLREVDDRKSWTLADSQTTPFNQFKLLFVSQTDMQIRTIVTKNTDPNYPNNVPELALADRFNLPSQLDVWMPTSASSASGILAYNTTNGALTLNNPNPTNLSIDLGPDIPVGTTAFVVLDAGAGFESYTWSTGETTQAIVVDGNTPSLYTVSANQNGCTVQDEIIIFGTATNTSKTYEVDGDNLYTNECSDCFSGPDPKFRLRVNDNFNTTWQNWDKDFSDVSCGWLDVTNYSWSENTTAIPNTVITIQMDAWEADSGIFCGDDDGACGGYQTVGTHTLCDLPPCEWHYFDRFRSCTSDGSTIEWGVRYSYRYTYDNLQSGIIANVSTTFCDSYTPMTITSTMNATQWADYQWETSTDGITWTAISIDANLASFTPSTLTATTYFRRRANDCSGREAFSNVVVFTKEDASTPYEQVVDSSALHICNNTATTIEVTGGVDGTTASTIWYEDALLTSQIGTGAVFTTPNLTNNTTYYVVRTDNCGTTLPLIVDVSVVPDYLVVDAPSIDGLYQAGIQVATNGTVLVGTDAIFKAGTEICINPGFEVPLGASFLGVIETCNSNPSNPPSSSLIYSIQMQYLEKE